MIFSDIYTVKEVYSVLRQEHLYTSSSMPWLYTSLKDVKYQPALSDSIHNKLNEVFVYSYAVTDREHPIRNEYKHLTVNHNGDDHVSYESTVELHYNDLYGQGQLGHFIKETNTQYLQNAYDRATELLLVHCRNPKANKKCDAESLFSGFLYDVSGTATAIKVISSSQDFNATGNDMLDRLEKHCRRNPLYLDGEMILHADGRESFRINCKYHEAFWRERVASPKASRTNATFEVNQQKIELRDEQISRTHMYGLSSAVGNFLTEEQGVYINSVFPDTRERIFDNGAKRGLQNFRVDFEFVFENNELVDILLFRTLYEDFKEIETIIP